MINFLIAVPVVLFISFSAGFILAAITPEEDLEDQIRDDRDQIEYLKTWREKHKRS